MGKASPEQKVLTLMHIVKVLISSTSRGDVAQFLGKIEPLPSLLHLVTNLGPLTEIMSQAYNLPPPPKRQ